MSVLLQDQFAPLTLLSLADQAQGADFIAIEGGAILFAVAPPPPPSWILAGGHWNDAAPWNDAARWED